MLRWNVGVLALVAISVSAVACAPPEPTARRSRSAIEKDRGDDEDLDEEEGAAARSGPAGTAYSDAIRSPAPAHEIARHLIGAPPPPGRGASGR